MAADGGARFLIDGFPRNMENRDSFGTVMGYDCSGVLFFDCPEAVMERRLLSRNEGRTDDNIETIKRRFKVFVEQSMPVVDHYKELGKVIWADSDRSPDEIFAEIAPQVEKLVPAA
jgi:UMP-CMP kinase